MANLSNINNKFLVTTGGNVGIGDTGPSTRLTVDVPAILNNTVNIFQLGDDTNGLVFKKFWDSSGIAWRLNKGVSGINMMTFSQDGKVGIGTDSPVTKLHLYDNTATVGLSIQADNASSSDINLGDENDINIGRIKYDHSTDSMQFQTNNAERMRIDSSGRTSITGVFGAPSSSGSGNEGILRLSQSAGVGSMYMGFGDPYAWIQSRSSSNFSLNYDLALNPLGGNVGIGTTSPTQKLNVVNNNTGTWTAKFTNNTNNVYLSVNDANNYGIYVSGETKNYFSGNVGIGTTTPGKKVEIRDNSTSTSETIGLKIKNANANSNTNAGILFENYDNNSAYIRSPRSGSTAGILTFGTNNAGGTAESNIIERMRITSTGAISVGSTGTAYGAAGEVLTSNGNASPSWQAAGGGGSAWPQEKFAVYTINSTTSNILIATMNSTTWHGDQFGGCLKFTINDTNYIQVSYVTIYTFLSQTNKWFFKGNVEMTTHNTGTNPVRYVFAFAGNNGSYGTTCTLKINRASSGPSNPVNVLVQAISSPDMFILN